MTQPNQNPQQTNPNQSQGGLNHPQQTNPNQSQSGLSQLSSLGKKAGPLADILYAVAYILPASLARPLRDFANTLRRASQAAQRIERASDKLNDNR